ncbi:hypothetical protein GA0070607_6510 [Micromonospora coriariae]|uniref:Transposase n=1 Tax=Micromonospora coriariae TaxID=285665 RepID=A0A1C4YBX6_9ACTN|nr:hypothetical protein [Micromonospora coriariae]SCF17841.1 hypothetical protein GA0070607_6510 [Micromonospora coriariae]
MAAKTSSTYRPRSPLAPRLLDIGGARQSDPADAASVAHAAMRHKRLRAVVAEDHTNTCGSWPNAVTTWPVNAFASSPACTPWSAT